MKREITLGLKFQWILDHRHDEEFPMDRFIKGLKSAGYVDIRNVTFTLLTVVTEEYFFTDEQLVETMQRIFLWVFPEENVDEVLSVEINEFDEENESNSIPHDGPSRLTQIRQRVMQRELEKDNEILKKQKQEKIDGVLKDVSDLVGAFEFKALAREIAKVAPEITRKKIQPIFYNRSYLFSIGEGHGLTTYLSLLADLLSATELRQMHFDPVVELRLDPYKESMEPFDSVLDVLRDGDSDSVQILCIDISEWLGKTDNRHFRLFLRKIEKAADEFIIVFKVPFLDKDVLTKLNNALNDQLSVKTISFPPFSQEELNAYAKSELESYGFKISKSAWEYFNARITEEKSDGKFYGLNTVKKIVRELVYNKLLSTAGKEKESLTITRADTRTLCNTAGTELSGAEQLDKLIGTEQIKERIQEVIAQIELAIRSNSEERPCIHMRFVGNPGTGKTTVARIIGKLLKEKGILRQGSFFEHAGRDFCGRYIGETAPKTASFCRDAYGSILFIDEAYALYRGDDNEKDYGKEAIDTLIAEMENHRNDFVVIMAGYTDDMERLMKANQGLASRMPYTIEFPNFTREQLYEIFVSMVESKFKHDDYLFDTARAYFENLSDDILSAKEFSNARYVRNLFERTWAKAAMRCQLENITEVILSKADFERAILEKEFAHVTKMRKPIGFN